MQAIAQKRMRWVLKEDLQSYLEVDDGDGRGWVRYTQSAFYLADYQIPRGSLGFRTMQRLLKSGYVFEANI